MISASRNRFLIRSRWRCGVAIPLVDFLLECMENVEHALETNGVYGAIGVTIEVIADLNNAAAKAFQSLRTGGVFSELGFEQRLTELLTDRPRECPQVASAGPDEHRQFDQAQDIAHDAIIVVLL